MRSGDVRTLLPGPLLGRGLDVFNSHTQYNDAWNQCVADLLQLHLAFIDSLHSRPTPVQHQSPASNMMLSTIVAHAYNTTREALGLGYRGLFDVAGYLLRPLHDASGLAFLTGSDPNSAEAITLDREVKAADGRKAMLTEMRETGQVALADDLEHYWKDIRSKQLDQLSHTRLFHLDRVLQSTGDGRTELVLGGVINPPALQALIAVVLDAERDLLAAAWFVRRHGMETDWPDRIRALTQSGHERLGELLAQER